ncbi:MAG: hypothetical protein ACK5X3_17825 [Pseudomonadota bacterium]
MARREVTVVINGEETVSQATGAADGAMGGFIGKVPGWAKAIALVTAAFAAVGAVVMKVKDYVLDSIASYDRFAASQTKLAAQSKLTGVSMAELNRIAEAGRDAFGLSTVVANDAATTVAKYASRAGDATKANELLAKALDLGAAAGLDAAATMEALEQGLRGQDEGFDKLLGKNPSSIWKEFADANGLAVGKMTDTQKRMAELTAIMDAGNIVQGSYNDRMESGAGAQDRLNNKLDEAKVAFGQAIQPARIFITQGLTNLVEVGGRVVLAIGRIANALVVVFTGAVEGARSIVGDLAIGIGKLTGSKEIEEWGRRNATAFSDFRAQMGQLEDKYLTTGKAAQESETKQVTAARNVAAAGKAAAETTEQAADRLNKALDAKLGRPMAVAIGLTEGAVTSLGRAAVDQLPTQQSEKFLTHMQGLVTASESARDRILGIKDGTGTAATRTRDMAREVETFARGTLDAANAFGVIDDAAARSLNSAISIASAIGNIIKSGFSFAGVTGVIGGVASLVSGMMAADAERRRLLRENNVQLQKLREEGVTLSTKVSGEKLSKLTQALSGDDLLSGEYFADKERSVLNQLAAFGLSLRDLEAVAAEYGIQGITKNGKLNDFRALRQLIEALQIGGGKVRVGQSFSDQLQFFRDTQSNDGADGLGALQGLIDFLRNVGGVRALDGIDVMADPQAAASRLRGLFTQLSNGGIESSAIGRLTGSQFSGLLMELIRGLTGPAGATAPTGGGDVTVPTGTTGAGGPVSVPTATIQDVIKASTESMTAVLTVHTALHERIAAATEGSYMRLTSIDNKMDTLIDVTAGNLDATDAKLEAMRRLAALERGERPVLG